MRKCLILLAIFIFISFNLFSKDFKILGSRPNAMGGAYTALAEDAIGISYNPAGLASQRGFDLEIPFYVGVVSIKDIIFNADNAYDIGNNLDFSSINSSTQLDTQTYSQALKFLAAAKKLDQPGAGLIVDVNAGLNLRFGKFGLTINNYTMAAGEPLLDFTNISLFDTTATTLITELDNFAKKYNSGYVTPRTLSSEEAAIATQLANIMANNNITSVDTESLSKELVYQAAQKGITIEQMQAALPLIVSVAANAEASNTTATSIDNNQTKLNLNGISLTEVALSYGFNITRNLDIGISLKAMQGQTGFYSYNIQDSTVEAEDVYDDFKNDKKKSTTFGVDLGAIYDLNILKLGLVIKNINSPKFKNTNAAKLAGYDDIKFKPQARLGVAFKPFRRVIMTSDIDLTENETIMRNYKSRMLGAGLELNLLPQERKVFNIALRGGIKKNLAESDDGMIVTGGVGISLLHIQINLSGSMSTKKAKIEDGDEIPTNFSASGTVSINF
ncbi:MAG TPA: conjugal transfer protein TraF [bacterium]|nr:conjugal transfer protein TraF [bacterium]HOL46650.1 conjugal transfer protein TraF [bacterium]HPQ17779.1 conjugal transfer protein TraF [bacterium]